MFIWSKTYNIQSTKKNQAKFLKLKLRHLNIFYGNKEVRICHIAKLGLCFYVKGNPMQPNVVCYYWLVCEIRTSYKILVLAKYMIVLKLKFCMLIKALSLKWLMGSTGKCIESDLIFLAPDNVGGNSYIRGCPLQ